VDRTVTVRFYEIEQPNDGSRRFEDILRGLADLGKRDREGELDDGAVVLRLEHLWQDPDGILIGDLTRVQTHNLPSHVIDENVERLPVDEIGHSAVFLFDPETGCLAYQFDMRMGVGRLCRYLRQFGPGSAFRHFPYLKRNTLERFRDETPVTLRLRVARVRNFQRVPEFKTDFEEQLEEWSRFFDAPSIEIKFSTRGQGKELDKAGVWNTVRRWIRFKDEIEGIKNIEAKTIETDQAFDFIKDLLFEEAVLDLPDNDPDASRSARIEYIREMYTKHKTYIQSVSGA
jgi:hypothetical protein